MKIEQNKIQDYNQKQEDHQADFQFLAERLNRRGVDVENLLEDFKALQIAIPSWALGSGGTRFGRFALGGQPGTLEEKMSDIGLIHQLTRMAGRISLHIPWDIPEDVPHIQAVAREYGLEFYAMNSNTFQDQKIQKLYLLYRSLSNTYSAVLLHGIYSKQYVIDYAEAIGVYALYIWLADG